MKPEKEIIQAAYENKFGGQSYEKSALHHTYEDVVILAMHEFASQSKEESPRWVSVEKELPKINHEVMVFITDDFGDNNIDFGRLTINNEWYRPFKQIEGVTHWMPLPPPPETGAELDLEKK